MFPKFTKSKKESVKIALLFGIALRVGSAVAERVATCQHTAAETHQGG